MRGCPRGTDLRQAGHGAKLKLGSLEAAATGTVLVLAGDNLTIMPAGLDLTLAAEQGTLVGNCAHQNPVRDQR